MRVLAIIPAHNEERVVDVAIDSSRFVNKVLVVDDGSGFPVRKSRRYIILRNNKRRGKGYSLRRGFDYAIRKGYDIVIAIDGDREHDPKAIPLFLKGIKSSDIVIGQRTAYRSFQRSFLNEWAGFWVRLLLPIRDTQCGFIALRTDLLKRLKLTSQGFSINLEILLEAFKNNAEMGFVPLKKTDKKSSYVTFKDYIRINNMFDKWVIENYKYLRISILKKILLLSAAIIGGAFGRLIE